MARASLWSVNCPLPLLGGYHFHRIEFPPERFRSQDFWDCFDKIKLADSNSDSDELEEAQVRLLGSLKEKQMVSHRLLAYDTTNFYTWTASTNKRNTLAQRGHNKQGRNNLRQEPILRRVERRPRPENLSLIEQMISEQIPQSVCWMR